MKVNEFIEKVNANKGRLYNKTDATVLMNFIKETLEVKDYLGVDKKKELAQNIIDASVYYDNGILKVNGIENYINLIMLSIDAYTNIELSENINDDYDELCKSKLLGKIVDVFEEEYKVVSMFVKMQEEFILADNSITAKFGVAANLITDKVVELADVLKEKIATLNIDINNEELKKIISSIGGD